MADNQTGSAPVEPVLAALVDMAFKDGRHEMDRAIGKRGVVTLSVKLVLGDHGRVLESAHSIVFEQKLHVKDGFKRGPNDQA
jgi:hypothetical protein